MTRRQTIKLIFHKDTIAFIASMVFVWFTISLIADENYEQNNLTRHTGYLVKIDSGVTKNKNKLLFKETTKMLLLKLNTEQVYFTSISTNSFGYITSKIATGDSVIIFTKPKLWGIFGLKKSNDISQLTKGKVTVIDFKKYKQSISGLFVLTLIPAIVFLIVYYIRTRKRWISDIFRNP